MSCVGGCSKSTRDDTIAKNVQDKIAADPVTKDAAVSVDAKDGKVVLKGTVKDTATQQRIDQIAHDEPGAKGVDDETAVAAGPGPLPDQAANASGAAPAAAPPPPPPLQDEKFSVYELAYNSGATFVLTAK